MNLHKITRSIVLGALFLIPVFPLIVSSAFFFPFIVGKAFYFRLLVEVAFAGWLILAFLDAKYRPRLTPIAIGITVFAIIALVADLFGINPIRSLWSNFERMEGWIAIAHLWMFFMAASNVFGADAHGRKLWYRWFNVWLAAAVYVSGYGISQLFGGAAIHQGSTRIDASLGNAAYMGVYMLWNTGIAAYMFFVARAGKVSNAKTLVWIYALLGVLFSFLLFETATRGTILGLIGGVLLALFLYAVLGKKEGKRRRLIATGALVAILAICGIFWLKRDLPFIRNHEVLGRLAGISLTENKTQARGYIWPMAIGGAFQSPKTAIIGWGQENFNYIFNANYNPLMWAQEQWFDRAHNVFLDWLVASGLLGLTAYVALYILLLIAVWKSDLSIAQKSVWTGTIAGYAVHNFFVFDNIASYVPFFAMLAFADRLFVSSRKPIFGKMHVPAEVIEYAVTPIVIIALVAGVYFFQVRPINANTGLIKALMSCSSGAPDAAAYREVLDINVYVANQEVREQLFSCAGAVITGQYPDPTKKAFYDLAIQEIDKQTKATPDDARTFALAGSFLNQINSYTEAEKYLQRGHDLSPAKQSLDFELANAYLNNSKPSEAAALLKVAYESAPENPNSRLAYTVALIFAGSDAEARRLFGDDPGVFQNEAVAQAYMVGKQYSKAIAIYKAIAAADASGTIDSRVRVAQAQYAAGLKYEAIQTLRDIAKDRPEYATQIQAAIDEAMK